MQNPNRSQGNPATTQNKDLTIVALGASAGGIEVSKDLISHLPPDTGMGFVVVQHLDPPDRSVHAGFCPCGSNDAERAQCPL
jgi:two-component system CheB/CheR fusion protein